MRLVEGFILPLPALILLLLLVVAGLLLIVLAVLLLLAFLILLVKVECTRRLMKPTIPQDTRTGSEETYYELQVNDFCSIGQFLYVISLLYFVVSDAILFQFSLFCSPKTQADQIVLTS